MPQGSWAGLINTTIPQYIPGVAERNIFRNRKTWALIRQKGLIFTDGSGTQQDWKVEYREAPIRPFGADTGLVYARINRWFTAQLEWRGYALTDAMGLMEQAQNKGQQAIINVFGQKAESLMNDATRKLGDELYVDGTITDNSLRFHGVPSFLSYTIDSNTYTTDRGVTHRPTALPAAFYANRSCVLGALGGSWQGLWPDGQGDTEYDAWSPKITHYGSDYFGATPTWDANGHPALAYHIIHSYDNNEGMGLEGTTGLDLITMSPRMYFSWTQNLEEKERINVTQRNTLLNQLGFGPVTQYMGVDVTWEYKNPENEFYSWNFDALRVTSLMPQLFTPYGPFKDPHTLGDMWAIVILGNIRCNPRGFGKGVLS
jgi:hypothetical protein